MPDQASAVESPNAQEQHRLRGRVLVADDDPAMVRLLSSLLSKNGYFVETAADGLQAIQMAQDTCPDFLIVDWEMPGLTGPEVCRRIREAELPRYVYTLLLTARSKMDDVVQGLEAGADDFLSKPVVSTELLARLHAGRRVLDLEACLLRTAAQDPLTGVLNRRAFFEQFNREWSRSSRYGLPMSCVILDVDFFKSVNDRYGHATGDQVIQLVANLMTEFSRASDYVCRLGGEEFCALLPETDESQAAVWADRVRQALPERAAKILPDAQQVTGSFGVAGRSPDVSTPEALVDRADQALLAAKQCGRNRVIQHRSLDEITAETAEIGKYSDLFTHVTAKDVMTQPISALADADDLDHASKFLIRLGINSAPVVDAHGLLVGILSEKDVLASLSESGAWQRRVEEVMTRHVVSFAEDTPIRAIYEFLMRLPVRRVVIVRDGKPTGVISRGAMLRWFQSRVAMFGAGSHRATPVGRA